MTTDATVDAIVADHGNVPAENQETTQTNEPVANEGEANEPADKGNEAHEDDVPFPKKAINALSRRDKQIGKYRAELAAERAQVAAFKQQIEELSKGRPDPNKPPEVSQFDNYGNFLLADAKFKAMQELKEQGWTQGQPQTQTPQVSPQEAAWVEQRETHIAQQANEILAANPEYQQILTENADILDTFPPHIERAFLEADNAAQAFVVRRKAGSTCHPVACKGSDGNWPRSGSIRVTEKTLKRPAAHDAQQGNVVASGHRREFIP